MWGSWGRDYSCQHRAGDSATQEVAQAKNIPPAPFLQLHTQCLSIFSARSEAEKVTKRPVFPRPLLLSASQLPTGAWSPLLSFDLGSCAVSAASSPGFRPFPVSGSSPWERLSVGKQTSPKLRNSCAKIIKGTQLPDQRSASLLCNSQSVNG